MDVRQGHLEEEVNEALAPRAEVPDVRLQEVVKSFGDVVAVDGVSLDIERGEFFSLLGPSGSGKTTCLRMIAGFEEPTSGTILLGSKEVSGLPPYSRDVNTVFQDYALFPHMTVSQNVEYGLRVKGVSKDRRRDRVVESLRMVQLEGFETRKPSELSGGQRQRVALARALINEPRVLLLDEPLGALDLKLRQQMQIELKSIQKRVGLTFIYVTHDQEEALTMSDRLAVMNNGRIDQVGSPADVYESPASAFVAGFVGTSNVIGGDDAANLTGKADPFSIRPEKIRMASEGSTSGDDVTASGTIEEVVYLGAHTRYVVVLDDGPSVIVLTQNSTAEEPEPRGSSVHLAWRKQHNRPLSDADAGRSEWGEGAGSPARKEAP